ncbi:TPA: hypothetical protein ACHGDM_005247 [Escherichia coli]
MKRIAFIILLLFSFSSIAELYMTVNIGDENKTTAYNSIEDNYYITLHSEQVTASSESSGGTASPSAQGKLTLFDPLTNNILNNDIEATLQLIYRVKLKIETQEL